MLIILCSFFCKNNLNDISTILSKDSTVVYLEQPLMITFSVKNNYKKTQKFSQYMTPLEGFKGDILEVIDDKGNLIDYKGIQIKRGKATKKDYIKIQSNQSKTITFDLLEVYNISTSGIYTIQFKGRKSMNKLPDSNILSINIKD